MKNRPYHWVNLVAAPCASVSRVAFDSMELALLTAFRAVKCVAVGLAHQELQARIVSREAAKKALNSLFFHAIFPFNEERLHEKLNRVNFIIAIKIELEPEVRVHPNYAVVRRR